MAHPSLVEKEEIDDVKVPVQVLVPEHEPYPNGFHTDLRNYSNKTVPSKGLPYSFEYFV